MTVMAGVPTSPGPGQVPPAHLRVTDQDREHVVEHVKAAYAEGRFDKLEFDDRLDRAMTARTHGDLMPIMTELYGTHPVPLRRPMPAPIRPQTVPNGNELLAASAAHLLMLVGFPIAGPLILMLTGGKTSPFIRRHAVEALNFQLTLLGATILLSLTIIGLVVVPVIWMGGFVLSVIGGVSALSEKRWFDYPLTIRLVK
ncbi:DUF1707 and DUF4870 domain-containing protein [Nonomuraea cavernae]|uniref:DUF1707 and DUF4870 domain-containing protein n=1 Tax=Nonomuraea cavernae TaxID=2045107 RepID=UPI0034002F2B